MTPLDPKVVARLAIQSRIVEALVVEIGDVDLDSEPTWQRAERRVIDIVEDMETRGELPRYVDQDELIKDVLNEALALGPLEDLLADERVHSIAIHAYDEIVTGDRRRTTVFSSPAAYHRCLARFTAENAVTHVIRRLGNSVLIELVTEAEPPEQPPPP